MSIKKIISRIELHFSRELISAYMDGEIDRASKAGPLKARIEKLIHESPEAKAYYERVLKLDSTMKGMPEHAPPGRLKQRIDNAIMNTPAAGLKKDTVTARRRLLWIYAGTFAVVMLAVVTLFGIHSFKARHSAQENMFASIDMYRHLDLYEHMDMVEHLNEVMAVNQPAKELNGGGK
jgi:anti-sigma factor RsiW